MDNIDSCSAARRAAASQDAKFREVSDGSRYADAAFQEPLQLVKETRHIEGEDASTSRWPERPLLDAQGIVNLQCCSYFKNPVGSTVINRQRRNRPLATLCLAISGLFILMGFAARERGVQGISEMKLSVEDPRPVAQAILKLQEKYGWVITYEDPLYVHDSEIADVTFKVRKDLDKYKPGEAPKVSVPKGGSLEFTYNVMSDTNLPDNPAMVVQKLLDAQAASGNGGRFRLETRGQIMHVIPTAIKNSAGVIVSQESALDAIISLPSAERTVLQKLESICAAISRTTNIPVELGTIPTGLFLRYQDQRGAENQRARDVLVDTLETMNNETKLSWRLLHEPGMKKYYLNIRFVSKRDG